MTGRGKTRRGREDPRKAGRNERRRRGIVRRRNEEEEEENDAVRV